MAIIFALIALIGWGVGDICVTIASRKLGFLVTYFWAFVFGLIVIVFMMPFMGGISDGRMFFFAILLNLIHTAGNLSFFRGLEVGNASIVGTITGTFSIVSVILSLIFFKESVSWLQAIGITFAGLGVILVSLKLGGTGKISRFFADRGVSYAIVTLFCWGFYFAFVRIPAEKIGWFWAGVPLFLNAFLLLASRDLRKNMGKIFADKKGLISTITFMLLGLIMADFAYNIGILQGFTSIVAPIAGSSAVLFVILSRFVFGDRLNIQQKWGIAVTLLGILIVSFS
ncbi:hypothetical protein A3D03_01705 [Candidatus Gottesmanbacteria bacterium RIFCSPHIGHO2_02_FULL_40_13]|uniref:EamA domain-containing protein n=1 Tax=Candidatus Gottesmanbacteria bacterium RIFCSPHIGHO2_02_FULL_40_13 TaxID=1798384 RepID=A0A1F6A7A7_9BACT|nr:MAG: hypothetical protein A3D03_01705 [Candidatus Gottesmanbacteria bacterium RIFCSPHIGHO2_02_FULL_40_13]